MTGPADQDTGPSGTGQFDAEIRRDRRHEIRVAVKALIALAIVAALIAARLAGF